MRARAPGEKRKKPHRAPRPSLLFLSLPSLSRTEVRPQRVQLHVPQHHGGQVLGRPRRPALLGRQGEGGHVGFHVGQLDRGGVDDEVGARGGWGGRASPAPAAKGAGQGFQAGGGGLPEVAQGDAGGQGGRKELLRAAQFDRVRDEDAGGGQAAGGHQGPGGGQGKLDVAVDVLVGRADVA